MLTSRGLDVVLGDLASMGYHARWGVLGARHVGAPHRRDRIWLAARHADASRVGHCAPPGQVQARRHGVIDGGWWSSSSGIPRVAAKVANRVERLRAIGNGQVPAVAALAWQLLTVGWGDE